MLLRPRLLIHKYVDPTTGLRISCLQTEKIQNSIEQYVSIGNNDGCTEFKTGQVSKRPHAVSPVR